MPKLTAQDIPVEFATLYADFVSSELPNIAGIVRARSRKKNSLKPHKRKAKTLARALRLLIRRMAYAYAIENEIPYSPTWERARLREAQRGQFLYPYWRRMLHASTSHHTNTPTNTPDGNPPPYAYRDPLNTPTLAEYSPGTPTTGPASYHGEKIGTAFHDSNWTWRTDHYVSSTPGGDHYSGYAAITAQVAISIQASNRPSRPMASLMARLRVADSLTAYLDGSAPPRGQSDSWYSRYRPTLTAPPYYEKFITTNHLTAIRARTDGAPPDFITDAALTIAPRPMYGRGYNNNTSVTTEATPTEPPAIYMPAMKILDVPMICIQAEPLKYWNPVTGQTITTTSVQSAFEIISTNGEQHITSIGGTIELINFDGRILRNITADNPDHPWPDEIHPWNDGWIAIFARNNDPTPGYYAHRQHIYDEAGNVVSITETFNDRWTHQARPGPYATEPHGRMIGPVATGIYAFSHDPAALTRVLIFSNQITAWAASGDALYTLTPAGVIRRTAYHAADPFTYPANYVPPTVNMFQAEAGVPNLFPCRSGVLKMGIDKRVTHYRPDGSSKKYSAVAPNYPPHNATAMHRFPIQR